jgi:hypothetical protein
MAKVISLDAVAQTRRGRQATLRPEVTKALGRVDETHAVNLAEEFGQVAQGKDRQRTSSQIRAHWNALRGENAPKINVIYSPEGEPQVRLAQ